MEYAMLIGNVDDDGSIRRWVSNDTVDSITILDEAQDWIFGRLRDREMLAISTALTMTLSTDTLTCPVDFLAPVAFNISGAERAKLKLVEPSIIENNINYDSSGNKVDAKPDKYYVRGTTIQLNCPALKAYTTRLLYYAAPTKLGNSNTTNFLTNRYSRLIRLVCTAIAYEFLWNEKKRDYYITQAEREIADRKVQHDIDFHYDFEMDTDHGSYA